MMKKMQIPDKLGLNKFVTDEENSHITIDANYNDETEIKRLVNACPAALYRYENGELTFTHEGCLECGTCRVLSGGKIVKSWNHPEGEFGVTFKKG